MLELTPLCNCSVIFALAAESSELFSVLSFKGLSLELCGLDLTGLYAWGNWEKQIFRRVIGFCMRKKSALT